LNAVFFREVLNEDLGCASYVIADGGVPMLGRRGSNWSRGIRR
jgi:hypothetical protein